MERKTIQQCVNDLVDILKRNNLQFSCVNRVELDRQHLADVDSVIAVGGDGTCLSAAHFLGTRIPGFEGTETP